MSSGLLNLGVLKQQPSSWSPAYALFFITLFILAVTFYLIIQQKQNFLDLKTLLDQQNQFINNNHHRHNRPSKKEFKKYILKFPKDAIEGEVPEDQVVHSISAAIMYAAYPLKFSINNEKFEKSSILKNSCCGSVTFSFKESLEQLVSNGYKIEYNQIPSEEVLISLGKIHGVILNVKLSREEFEDLSSFIQKKVP
ncbi:hypothetical protein DICPUDRAFT_74840 [Dictyostelium purpureum]|uniref:Uncharacterized protein n=1 Tax=Dictyostelium purpureum TaxID=5786 RepID=F0Z8W4_DICPU|nr:uncharacterized protein DICPUDRAFT_74840 [Dictyostelium purpureum]EGC39615.1 hypothetical protein DICPUDRAFT_74840 [Dictyostelium purpureum]|eukprot:XP_003283836.1 hypothetical protein DICPUDRAFT_74840 [Dictyostelium purpureum]